MGWEKGALVPRFRDVRCVQGRFTGACAGRDVAFDVRMLERIELRPEHVALEADRLDASFLLLAVRAFCFTNSKVKLASRGPARGGA